MNAQKVAFVLTLAREAGNGRRRQLLSSNTAVPCSSCRGSATAR